MNDMGGLMVQPRPSRSVAAYSPTPMITSDMGGIVDANATPRYGSDMQDRARRVLENGGFVWKRTPAIIAGLNNTNMTTTSTGMGVTLFATSDRVCRTADYGHTWQNIFLPTNRQTKCCITDGLGRWFIMCSNAGSDNQFFYSLDNGLTWIQATVPGAALLFYYGVGAVNGYFWFGNFNGTQVWRSNNFIDWTALNIPSMNRSRWFVSDGKGSLACGGEGLAFPYLSYNNGLTWRAGALHSIADVSSQPTVVGSKAFLYGANTDELLISHDFFQSVGGYQVVKLPYAGVWSRLCYSAGLFLIIENNTTNYAMSLDGVDWVRAKRTLPGSQFYMMTDGPHVFTHFGFNQFGYYADF